MIADKLLETRRDRLVQQFLESAAVDMLVCAQPANVLMLSGYWPVVGTSIAFATRTSLVLLVPEDENDLAEKSFADEVITYQTGSLDSLSSEIGDVETSLPKVFNLLPAEPRRVGFESGETFEPASYAGMHLFGPALRGAVVARFPKAEVRVADDLLERLRAIHTPAEIAHIRTACGIAERAFKEGAQHLRSGFKECEIAAMFRVPLSACPNGGSRVERNDGFVWCMSGPNAARAYGVFARSRTRALEKGDLVLIHCNSYADGYWTDITRTFSMGTPDATSQKMYEAVFAARDAAFGAIHPGAKAADIDRAARNVLTERGYGPAFKHATGHGVGFAAISHSAPPRLHPKSEDVLEPGMVFNVEPGIYLEDRGMRHCDMVAVTHEGYELLTNFQTRIGELVL